MAGARPPRHHVVGKVVARVRARGFREVVMVAVGRVRSALHSSDRLIMLARALGDGSDQLTDETLSREATPADGERYAADIGTDSPGTFRARLSGTNRCFVVLLEGRIAHASWVSQDPVWTRELHRFVSAPSGDAYTYESFTRDEARGRGLYPKTLEEIARRLGTEGVRSLWVGVEENNPSSLRAVSKAGFVEAYRIGYTRKLGRITLEPPTGPRAELATTMLSSAGFPRPPGLSSRAQR